MEHVVWLIGALIVGWGLMIVFKPEWLKRILVFFSTGKRYLIAAGVRLLFGIIFLVFARDSRSPKTILFLGLLFLAAGILLLVMPPAKIKSILNWWTAKSVWVYRLMGVGAALLGAFIIYSGWPK